MVAGLRAADGREVDKPSLWWGGREVEEPQLRPGCPGPGRGFAWHPWARMQVTHTRS